MRQFILPPIVCGLILGVMYSSSGLADRRAEDVDEPKFATIPNACEYLTQDLAVGMLRMDWVQASSANTHMPTFMSNCDYFGQGVIGRKVGFTFKFMVYDVFDVERLDPMQLEFNVSFAGGGKPAVDTIDDLGKKSFVFEDRNRTTLIVITGIQGPLDGALRPSEFIALYYLEIPDVPYAEKRDQLVAQARRHLDEWL